MADRWARATDNYFFRFFSPEQIEQILRGGLKRGRTGSHSAIERILKHEPGLGRAELWRQIRRLKQPANGKLYQRTVWSPEDDQILRKGYEEGWKGKREAVRELLRRHPVWPPHSIWGRAAKLGLVRKSPHKIREHSRQLWTEDDDRILLAMAGYKTAKFIAKALHRSENAVRYHFAVLGKSSRAHLEGYARRTLSQELHLGSRTIQRLIVQGLLEIRSQNELTEFGFAKDYDAIVTVRTDIGESKFALEYERTPKPAKCYRAIAAGMSREVHVQRLLYLVANFDILRFVSSFFIKTVYPVYFGLFSDWHSYLLETPVLDSLAKRAFPLRQALNGGTPKAADVQIATNYRLPFL